MSDLPEVINKNAIYQFDSALHGTILNAWKAMDKFPFTLVPLISGIDQLSLKFLIAFSF